MAIATPSPSNDAGLLEQLNITRDASIANLEQKSSEVQQQYREEAAKIQDQQKVENSVLEYINASPDGTKRINYNRLTGVPLHLEADLIRTSQITLKARDAYLDTHPEERNNPMLQVHIGEDGFTKFGSELQEHIAIASPGVQANPNEPLVTFIDQPDGTFDAKLVTGETFRGFKANENRDAIRKIAESKVNTRRHYENLAQQQQPTNDQQPQPQAQPPVNESPSLTDWFLDETAKRFGYQNGAEMVADQNARYARVTELNLWTEPFDQQRKRILAAQRAELAGGR
jgi:hypothetical protein